MKKLSWSNRFSVQLVIAFILFTLGTTLAFSIPVALLFQKQTELQVESLMKQADQTTSVLLQNKIIQLQNLSLLIAERPTLNQLVFEAMDNLTLDNYLIDLIEKTDVEAINICGPQGKIAGAGESTHINFCASPFETSFKSFDDQIWLTSASFLRDSQVGDFYVILGQRAGSIFMEFSPQSGLLYALFYDDHLISTSSLGQYSLPEESSQEDFVQDQTLRLDLQSGETQWFLVDSTEITDDGDLKLFSLLNIDEYYASSRQLRLLILVTLIAVSLIGAIVAVIVSKRISKPLNQLARSAAALRGGDLQTPLFAPSKVWEVNQLTNALEDARVSLKHSLDQLQKEKAWIENVLDSIVEGLLTLDDQSRVTYASKGVERILRTQAVLMIGHPIDDFIHPAAGEDAFSMQLPGPYQSRRVPVLIDGYEALLSVSTSEFIPPDAGNASRAIVIRDVSDEERVHRLMGEFMANITHEFRTPLSSLAASVELLMEQLSELTTSEIEQLLGSLNVAIINLQSMIDNLLEAASIEAGRFKVKPAPIQLDDIIAEAVRTIIPIATRYGLRIKYQPNENSICVMADQKRTVQALVNLLSNAIKHSPEGGTISVASLIVNDKALVEVRDQGEGVPPEKRGQLFHRFAATGGDNASRSTGFGLGLSVVKAIINAQRGETGLKDQEQGGSCFWFTLPLVKGGSI